MFAKIFAQIFDSSIVENSELRFTFMDMLVLADRNGVVDMTHEAIARRTNRPITVIRKTITDLESADGQSRTPDFDGARIKRLDDHRDWGWMIVNYQRFRETASEEQRREKTLARVHKHREKRSVTPCNARNAMQREMQREMQIGEADAETIYCAYPRKIGRPKALVAITKALSAISSPNLLAKTQAFALAQNGADPQFIPHPATWFNQERFNDDPSTWKRSTDTKPPVRRENINVPITRR